jgi:hypothetical protein
MNEKKMSKLGMAVIIGFIFICCNNLVIARGFQGTLDFSLGYPQEEFKENIDKTALGLGLTFGIELADSPLMVGVDLGILNYGNDERMEYLYDIPEFRFKVVHSYNIFQGLVFLRFQPVKKGSFRPYIDALAGVNYFWTETSLEDDDWDGEEITLDVNHDDVAFTYGLGGGVMIKFAEIRSGEGKTHVTELFVDLRVRYIFGGRLQYLRKGSVIIEDQQVTYLVYESRSNLFTLQIGLGMNF